MNTFEFGMTADEVIIIARALRCYEQELIRHERSIGRDISLRDKVISMQNEFKDAVGFALEA